MIGAMNMSNQYFELSPIPFFEGRVNSILILAFIPFITTHNKI